MPPSLKLLRRAGIFGVLAFHFRQICQNTIRRVLTRVLRKDFILAKVFYFDLSSDFEENFSDICLKRSQHAWQSCIFFVQKIIWRTKYNFFRDNEVLFSSFPSFDIFFVFSKGSSTGLSKQHFRCPYDFFEKILLTENVGTYSFSKFR